MVGPTVLATSDPSPSSPRPSRLQLRVRGPVLTLYLDASALVKVFVTEAGSDVVLGLLQREPSPWTSRIAFVETVAAIARLERERRVGAAAARRTVAELERKWTDLSVVELDAILARDAAVLVRQHALRAGDAVHLASATLVGGDDPGGVTLATWDRRLWQAAQAVGFRLAPGEPPW